MSSLQHAARVQESVLAKWVRKLERSDAAEAIRKVAAIRSLQKLDAVRDLTDSHSLRAAAEKRRLEVSRKQGARDALAQRRHVREKHRAGELLSATQWAKQGRVVLPDAAPGGEIYWYNAPCSSAKRYHVYAKEQTAAVEQTRVVLPD